MKKCSLSLAIKEMQIETTVRFYFTSVRIATYMDYRPKINAVILLDMDHTLSREGAWEE
jgi:hypothetical protein